MYGHLDTPARAATFFIAWRSPIFSHSFSVLLAFLVLCSACTTALPPRPVDGPGPSAAYFSWVVGALTAEEMEGRGLGSEGLEQAASRVEQEFSALGLEAIEGSYRQPFQALIEVRLGAKNTLTLSGIQARIGRDFVPLGFSPAGAFSGSLVFVGYGIRAEALGYDDYADVDVVGKIALALRYEPGESNEDSAFEGSRGSRWSDLRAKARWAQEAGAQALLVMDLPREGGAAGPLPLFRQRGSLLRAELPVLQVNADPMLRHLLQRFGYDLMVLRDGIDREQRPHSFALPSIAVSGEVDVETTQVRTDNLLGVFPGRGALAEEVVVVSAHYDHLGRGGQGSRFPAVDAVHPGADDNASGVAALLGGVAGTLEHVKREPGPRRTLVVVAFSGGEVGNAGAYAYVRTPAFPLRDTVAILSLDRVGRLRDGGLQMLGADSSPAWETLIRTPLEEHGLEAVAASGGIEVSDPAPFYARGIPVLQLTTGEFHEQRTPADDPATLDAEGGAQIAGFVGGLLTELLTRESRPAYRHSSDRSLQFRSSRYVAGGAYLGTIPDVTQISVRSGGVVVAAVAPGSPAEEAGVRGGDRIIRMAGFNIPNIEVFTRVLADYEVGERVVIEVLRGAEHLRFWASLRSRKELWSQ